MHATHVQLFEIAVRMAEQCANNTERTKLRLPAAGAYAPPSGGDVDVWIVNDVTFKDFFEGSEGSKNAVNQEATRNISVTGARACSETASLTCRTSSHLHT